MYFQFVFCKVAFHHTMLRTAIVYADVAKTIRYKYRRVII